jgi:hypothetical protein
VQIYFWLSVILVAFLLGNVTHKFQLFPSPILSRAYRAFYALVEARETEDVDPHILETTRKGRGVTVYDRDASLQGNTFMTLATERGFGAILVNPTGDVLHTWHIKYSDVWPDAPHLVYQSPDRRVDIHGAWLSPHGEVVLNFESGHFPFGGGTVRIDKCSNLIWSLAENTHHAVFRDDKEHIWITSHMYHGENTDRLKFIKAPYLEDYVLKLSEDGTVLDRISVLEALYKSGLEGLIHFYAISTIKEGKPLDSNDVVHLNDVDILSDELAPKFALFKAGDIMISLRNVNTIAILDKDSKLVKWWLTGAFFAQHDPDFLPNGHILLYDNRRDRQDDGGSRLLEIDPVSRKVVWEYWGNEARPFYSKRFGKQQPLENGNILVTESEGGRVFEIRRNGQVVWEYINAVEDGKVGRVSQADRLPVGFEQFLGQACP